MRLAAKARLEEERSRRIAFEKKLALESAAAIKREKEAVRERERKAAEEKAAAEVRHCIQAAFAAFRFLPARLVGKPPRVSLFNLVPGVDWPCRRRKRPQSVKSCSRNKPQNAKRSKRLPSRRQG